MPLFKPVRVPLAMMPTRRRVWSDKRGKRNDSNVTKGEGSTSPKEGNCTSKLSLDGGDSDPGSHNGTHSTGQVSEQEVAVDITENDDDLPVATNRLSLQRSIESRPAAKDLYYGISTHEEEDEDVASSVASCEVPTPWNTLTEVRLIL